MGLLSATALSLLQQRYCEAYWLLEVDMPTATTARFTQQGVHVKATGYYESWLLNVGAFTRSLSNWRNGLQGVTFSASINDIAGQFSQLYGRKFRGAVVRLKLLLYDTATATQATHTCFTGIVDSVSKSDDVVSISCRIDDDWLEKRASRAWIRNNSFPNLNGSDARDKSIPFVMGTHDSTGLNATGMVQALLVDTVNFRYVISMGHWLYDIARVYADGALVTPDQYEKLETWTADGRKVTLIDFVADQGTKTITCDVQMVTATSSGGYTAGYFLNYLLVNYVYNDFHNQAFTTPAPLNNSTYTDLDKWIWTSMAIDRSFYLPPEGITGREILRKFLDSFDALAYWSSDGQLKVTHWEYRTQNDSIYPTARLLTDADMLTKPSFEQDPESVVNRLHGAGSYRGADGQYLNQRTVYIETYESEREAKVEAPWLVASADFIGSTTELTTDATTSSSVITATGGAATIHQNLAQAFDSAVYVETNSAGTANFICTLSNIPTVASIESVKIEYWARRSGAGTSIDETTIPGLYIGATKYAGNTLDQISTSWRLVVGGVWTVNPATGLKFTESDINSLSVRFDWDAGTTVNVKHRYAKLRIVVYYTASVAITPGLLTVLSKRVNRYGVSPELLRVEVPLEYLDYELGDLIQVQDIREGWGDATYERELMRVIGVKIIPEKYRVELLLESVMNTLTSFRLFGKALESIGTTGTGDGVLLLTHGGQVTVSRANAKYLDGPNGGTSDVGPLIGINANTLPCSRWGCVSESGANGYLKGSAFQSGSTYTDSMPAGSGTIADDTTVGEQLFPDSTITDRHCLFTAASPHTATSRRTWAASHNIGAGTPMRVSIVYKCSSSTGGDGPSWRLVRDADGFYWNDSTQAWGAAAADNALTAATVWTRAYSKAIPSTVSKSNTFTFSISLPSGGTASRTVRIGHAQLTGTNWPCTDIVSSSSASVLRSADVIKIDNDKSDGTTTFRTWPNTRGSAIFKVTPNWNTTDAAFYVKTEQFPLFELGYDASNWWRVYYDLNVGTSTYNWVFQARAGGVNYTAQVADTAVADGDSYEIRVRWTSTAQAEWGYSNYLTLYVFRNGVLVGSNSIAYVTPTIVASSVCYLFNNAGGYNFNGEIQEVVIKPRCMSDTEMAKVPV